MAVNGKIDKKQIPELAKKNTEVIYEDKKYKLIGYQVLYKQGEKILSVVLLDEMNRLLWVRYDKLKESYYVR